MPLFYQNTFNSYPKVPILQYCLICFVTLLNTVHCILGLFSCLAFRFQTMIWLYVANMLSKGQLGIHRYKKQVYCMHLGPEICISTGFCIGYFQRSRSFLLDYVNFFKIFVYSQTSILRYYLNFVSIKLTYIT